MLASRKLFRWEVFKGGSEIFKTWAECIFSKCVSPSEMLISTLPKTIIFNSMKVFATLTPWTKKLWVHGVRHRSHKEHMVRLSLSRTRRGLVITVIKQSEQCRGETHSPQNKKNRKKTKSSHVCTRSRSISLSEGGHTLWTPCIHWRGRRTSASLPEHNEYIII